MHVQNILMKGSFKYLNDRFPYLSYTSTHEIPTLREKVTLFGRSLPVEAIIGSTPPPPLLVGGALAGTPKGLFQ